MTEPLAGAAATEIAARVRSGALNPVEVVQAHLDRIAAVDDRIGAFQLVRGEAALREAADVAARPDLAELPLAGVPVAVKDVLSLTGAPTRLGSLATSDAPATHDHEIVRRLRNAGAIVVGKTRVPELCSWAFTDSAFGITRSPWDPARTAGGSSGGSAAAVAAGMVALAHGSDGGGSIRIPAACCGLFGIKPGEGVVPGSETGSDWFGLSAHGPLATTVDDAAVALAVMADRPDLVAPLAIDAPLRIAMSVRLPFGNGQADAEYVEAVRRTADVLTSLGHEVRELDPPYDRNLSMTAGARAISGIAEAADGLPRRRLERRSRPYLVIGNTIRRGGWLRDEGRRRWQRVAADFFADADVVLTPTLARLPIAAEDWWTRSFRANARVATFAPYTQPWNVAGYPAAAVPVAHDAPGVPMSVQLVAPTGGEALLLAVARQLETAMPWQRHAPLTS
ncbi:MAG TPA: amidase family protein [Mycobacteriales bacterium]|nr:amidase family protein [Mycobacteriales bacterium]